jgi:hypothetical protein
MDILSLVNIWTPFTIYVAPSHWHDFVGASTQLYVLIGASTERYETTGPSGQQYILEGCR